VDRVVVRNLQIHVADACNLACEGCSHYSNYGHKGIRSLATAEEWMAPWAERLLPRKLVLLGGEPAINPELPGYVTLSRRLFPDSEIRVTTNGFLLHRHDPALPEALREAGNSRIIISIHHEGQEYLEKLKPSVALALEWRRKFGVEISFRAAAARWRQTYRGSGDEMEPFVDGDARASWENCPGRHCLQIFEGQLYKCAAVAYLGMQHAKYGLSSSWEPYLAYTPLSPRCSDAELREFVAREEEPCCEMCPSSSIEFTLPSPLRTAKSADIENDDLASARRTPRDGPEHLDLGGKPGSLMDRERERSYLERLGLIEPPEEPGRGPLRWLRGSGLLRRGG
jgi:hypothetical protein